MPRVLLVGASGFIGSAIQRGLIEAGCEVVPASRRPAPGGIAVDFTTDVDPAAWLPRLAGIDVVVNAAGAFQDKPGNALRELHGPGPRALFDAAAQAQVRLVIQVSALGAGSAATRYFGTKRSADQHLMDLPVPSVILRPSLVFGPGGASATVMLAVASLPFWLLPRAFRSRVQPVHIDDLVAAVVRLVQGAAIPASPLAVVGARPCTLRDFLQSLRSQLGFPRARAAQVPGWMIRLGARFPPLARTGLLSAEAMKMLEAGSTADPGPFTQLLGRSPRDTSHFIAPGLAAPLATQATLTWTLPLLRAAIAALWIITGVISLGIYPVESSYELLARLGIGPALQPLMLYGAAAFDIALGVAVLMYGGRALVWRLQIALVLLYTVLISIWLPEFWLHPFGPLTKNIPLLASFYMLQRLAVPRWNT